MAFGKQVARWALGCAIASVVPLAIWSGGCGGNTVVQVDAAAEGGPADGTSDDRLTDATAPDMGTTPQCCSEAESNDRRCSTDGTSVETCTDWFMGGQCPPNNGATTSSYGYVWLANKCTNGCMSSGGSATCNP